MKPYNKTCSTACDYPNCTLPGCVDPFASDRKRTMTKEQITQKDAAEANLLENGWSFKPFSNGTSGEVELSAIEYWNESVRCFEAGAEWQAERYSWDKEASDELIMAAKEALAMLSALGKSPALVKRLSSALKPFEK